MPAKPGERTDRMVSFDDLIPTVMSMAGLEKPNYVTGKPFMGQFEEEPRKYVQTFRTNTANHIDASRGVYDKKFQYIKYYTPHKRHALTKPFSGKCPPSWPGANTIWPGKRPRGLVFTMNPTLMKRK